MIQYVALGQIESGKVIFDVLVNEQNQKQYSGVRILNFSTWIMLWVFLNLMKNLSWKTENSPFRMATGYPGKRIVLEWLCSLIKGTVIKTLLLFWEIWETNFKRISMGWLLIQIQVSIRQIFQIWFERLLQEIQQIQRSIKLNLNLKEQHQQWKRISQVSLKTNLTWNELTETLLIFENQAICFLKEAVNSNERWEWETKWCFF